MNQNKTIKPEVGMGCTMGIGSDRYAGTIIEVSKSGKKIGVQYDNTALKKGFNILSENQEYTYTRNTSGYVSYFSLRKNGKFVQVGSRISGKSCGIGHRSAYRDPSF